MNPQTYPTPTQAETLLSEAVIMNPGSWQGHSQVAGRSAHKIARHCGLNPDKAYACGVLHDIGRRFGYGHFQYVADGYRFMSEKGYPYIARICLMHSFPQQNIDTFVGKFDVHPDIVTTMRIALSSLLYDDYDRLIQLCDALVGSEGVVNIDARIENVAARYGGYPEGKREAYLDLKAYCERRIGCDLYQVLCD